MLIAKYIDNRLVYGNHWDFFPNTQFGKNGPTENWLLDNDCYKVYHEKEYNSSTEKLVSADPYIEDEKVYIVTVEPKNEKDLKRDKDDIGLSVRRRRDSLLSETDWRFRSDLSPSQAWIDYCQALRDIPQQDGFPFDIQWPTKPDE